MHPIAFSYHTHQATVRDMRNTRPPSESTVTSSTRIFRRGSSGNSGFLLPPIFTAPTSRSGTASSPSGSETTGRPTMTTSDSLPSAPTAATWSSSPVVEEESSRDLPDYSSTARPIPIPSRAPIPSYDDAISTSPTSPGLTPGGVLGRGFSAMSIGSEGNALIRDSFGASLTSPRDTVFDDDEDDDPLTPRFFRQAPSPNLVPLNARRHTFSAASSLPTPPDESTPPDSAEIQQLDDTQIPLDLPPPPELPPHYCAHLGEDELRLISTVHLEENHPAAAFFSQMISSALSPMQDAAGAQNTDVPEQMTGGKKLRVTLTTGGQRVNQNGTGPLFIRLGRGGKVEGRIEVGKVDHVTALEVAIVGYVNTSYYLRGQYTLIDTLPLTRRLIKLYPPEPSSDGYGRHSTTISPNPIEATVPSPTVTASTSAAGSTAANSSSSPTAEQAHGGVVGGGAPKTITVGKDTYLAPDQLFYFSIEMPKTHYREENFELPPSAQIFQVGLQAGVEYVLQVKLSRKSWRLSESVGCPIVYEPRAYIPPRRLRALTSNDPLNPGWRTIRLNGGKAVKPADAPEDAPELPGVSVSLLLPSPPILFIPDGGEPPIIPFHLHFYSEATLPLATFSDPKECTFIIRFMRVASMRIGREKEIRRMEVPSTVEIWQEGGPHLVLGADRDKTFTKPASARPGPSGEAGSARRRSFNSFADRRPSFLKRKPSNAENDTSLTRQATNQPSEAVIVEDETPEEPPSILVPLGLGATDVHLLGQLKVNLPQNGPSVLRNLVQSFMSPEIGISYVLEIGLQPKNGAVKEAFGHVWGGGLVEVVLGHRNRDSSGSGSTD